MERLSIPKPVKKNDKNIAGRLRELNGHLSAYFEGVSRRTIYTTARRIGFIAVTRTEGNGLRVWRGDTIVKNVGTEPIVLAKVESKPENRIGADELPMDRAEKIANLKMLQDAVILGMNPLKEVEPEQVEDKWIYDKETYENGEILHWRHKPKGKPEIWKRESDLTGA